MIRKYLRISTIILIIAVLSAVTVSGIMIADSKTRNVGYTGRQPVINLTDNNDSATLSIMDDDFTLKNTTINYLSVVFDIYKKAAPIELKISSVLAEFIKMTVGRFAE